MSYQEDQNNGRAVLKDGVITIRLPVANLQSAMEGGWATQVGVWVGFPRHLVTDAGKFAIEVVRALNEEDELGTTLVHEMFDQALTNAIEQGAEGVEEHPEQEP